MRIAFAIFLAMAGCGGTGRNFGNGGNGGSGGSGGSGGTGGSGGSTDTPDMAQPPQLQYPSGPYGHQPGNVMPNLTLAGYRLTPQQTDSTQLSWDPSITFNDFHSNPACTCMLITIGAVWCGACQQEQPALVSDVSADPGFCVLGILQESDTQGVTASRADVDTWTQYYKQNFTVVQGTGATDNLLSGFGSTIGLPFNFVVKPQTMKVLDTVQGFDPQIHDYAANLCATN
jgi:hypothetical protein